MGNETLSLTLPVEDWLIIDATIDNTVAMASTDGDGSVAARGMEIRKAGWAATRAHPRHQDGWGGWPPRMTSSPWRCRKKRGGLWFRSCTAGSR